MVFAAALLIAAIAMPDPALSQDILEEITVTARKRSQDVQDVSMSISVLTGEQVAERTIMNAQDISWFTPGLYATGSSGDTDPLYTIRGIGLNDAFSNNNPTVGVYLDEVIQPLVPMMGFQLYDLDRIEVLKGPQGTLYGRNTTGGAVNVFTRRAGEELNGYARVDFGEFERFEFEGAVGGPLSETLSARVAALSIQQNDGWLLNAFNGQRIGQLDQLSVRGKLEWTPTDEFELIATVTRSTDKSDSAGREHVGFLDGPFSGNLCQAAIEGRRDETQCVSFLGYSDLLEDRYTIENSSFYGQDQDAESTAVTVRINWDIGDTTLTAVTGYSEYDRVYNEDADGTPLIMIDVQSTNAIDALSQEIRLSGSTAGGFDWVIGGFVSEDELFFDFQQALDEHIFLSRVSQNFTQVGKSWALFAHGQLPLSDRTRLVGGLRYTDEEKTFDYFGFDHDPFGTSAFPAIGIAPVSRYFDKSTSDEVTGEIGIEFDVSDDAMMYANVTKGFKSGGYKGAISFSLPELEPFDPETLYAYEVGVKSTLADGRLRLNAAGYYYDWKDFQAFVTEIRGGVPVLVLANAGDAEVSGLELDAQWAPVDGLQLWLGANLMDTEITRYNTIPGTGDNQGNRLSNSPEVMINARARYEFDVGQSGWLAFAASDLVYRSKVYYSLGNNGQSAQDAIWLWSGRAGLVSADEHWSISVWGKNLTDKFYKTQSYDNLGGIFPSQNYLGMPRSYGISVKYSF